MRLLSSLRFALPLLLCACSSIDVDSEHDPFADFASFTTFAQAAPIETLNPTEAELHAAIERALVAKGLASVARSEASLVVRHHLRLETKVELKDPYYAFRAVEQYEEGTLILDFVHAQTDHLVWRGTGSTRLEEEMSPEERRALIDRAVEAIVAQYPPGS